MSAKGSFAASPLSAHMRAKRTIDSVAADVAASAPSLVKGLSYSAAIRLAGDMRRPDRTELEAVMVAFVIYVPLGYYTWRFVMGLIG